MDYSSWNDLLAAHFFRPGMAGRRVFLYVTNDVVDQIGRSHGSDHADFVRAVLQGPAWATSTGLCHRAHEAYVNWRQRDLSYPPYIAHLALFVIAAGLGGEFAPHAYYPRLRTLIGETPTIGQYQYFYRMHDLWHDLERWSQEDKAGELGIFRVVLANKWQHVGIPIGQTLLTQEEIEELPRLFSQAGLDPTSPPSEAELANIISSLGANTLRSRTIRLLGTSHSQHSELSEALAEILLDELLNWDGTRSGTGSRSKGERRTRDAVLQTPAAAPTEQSKAATTHTGSLRLRIQYDRVAARMRVFVHCRSVHPLPDEGLLLHVPTSERRYSCEDLASGWSAALEQGDGEPLNATDFDWKGGVELSDDDGLWQFRFPGAAVRVFVSGAPYGIPDLVEERRLPTTSQFYVAASAECCALITRWGQSGCTGFRELPVLDGLPPGWRFFFADRVNNDELPSLPI